MEHGSYVSAVQVKTAMPPGVSMAVAIVTSVYVPLVTSGTHMGAMDNLHWLQCWFTVRWGVIDASTIQASTRNRCSRG